MIHEKVTFWKSLKSGFKGGLIGAGVNIGWLFSISFLLNITGLPKGFPIAVVFSTLIPAVIAAFIYAFLTINFKKGNLLFYFLAVGFTVLSIFPSFMPLLPDGTAAPANFAILTVPMHFFAALSAVFYIAKGK